MRSTPILASLTCSLLAGWSRPAPQEAGEGPWERWLAAEEGGYEAKPVADGRVLLVTSRRRGAGSLARTIERTLAFVDDLVPAKGDAATAVPAVFDLEDSDALGRLKAFLGAEYPYLAGWAASGGTGVGFVIEEPLCAAWLHEVPGVKKSEWKPENELTNRLAQALLVQRHGRLPQWLVQGLAWHVELETRRGIYCFPFRAGFVGKREHKGWYDALAASMGERGERPLAMTELTDWPRGTYDDGHAALAWGAGKLIARYFPDALPRILEELEAAYRTGGRVSHPDGSWESVPDYEVPPEEQQAILDAALGTDFLVELGRFARLGRSYVRPR